MLLLLAQGIIALSFFRSSNAPQEKNRHLTLDTRAANSITS